MRQDARVVAGHLQSPPGEIRALCSIRCWIFAPAIRHEPVTTERGASERWSITRIASDRLLHQTQRLRGLPCRRPDHCIGTQIEVIGCKIVGRTVGRTGSLSRLQCRLDDAGDADCDLVLELENVHERAVEALGPEVRATSRVD